MAGGGIGSCTLDTVLRHSYSMQDSRGISSPKTSLKADLSWAEISLEEDFEVLSIARCSRLEAGTNFELRRLMVW